MFVGRATALTPDLQIGNIRRAVARHFESSRRATALADGNVGNSDTGGCPPYKPRGSTRMSNRRVGAALIVGILAGAWMQTPVLAQQTQSRLFEVTKTRN